MVLNKIFIVLIFSSFICGCNLSGDTKCPPDNCENCEECKICEKCSDDDDSIYPPEEIPEYDEETEAYIPPGKFLFTEYNIEVDMPGYIIDKFEVSEKEYGECVDSGFCPQYAGTPCAESSSNDIYDGWGISTYIEGVPLAKSEFPAITSWYHAKRYCDWLDKRLPTNMEWEKAARGHEGRRWTWTNKAEEAIGLCNYANMGVCEKWDENTLYDLLNNKCNSEDLGYNPIVSEFVYWPTKNKNKDISYYGVYNMCGNAQEWVDDWFYSDQGKNRDRPVYGSSIPPLVTFYNEPIAIIFHDDLTTKKKYIFDYLWELEKKEVYDELPEEASIFYQGFYKIAKGTLTYLSMQQNTDIKNQLVKCDISSIFCKHFVPYDSIIILRGLRDSASGFRCARRVNNKLPEDVNEKIYEELHNGTFKPEDYGFECIPDENCTGTEDECCQHYYKNVSQ